MLKKMMTKYNQHKEGILLDKIKRGEDPRDIANIVFKEVLVAHYTKIKARITMEKFARLVRVNFKKAL